jgi:phosphonate transport system substrate-binding protein
MVRLARRSTRRAFLGTIAAGTLSGCLRSSGSPTMTVGIVPDVDQDTAIKKNQLLADYLESKIDTTIKLRTTASYAGLVQAMISGQVGLAYFGGVSYTLAHHRANAEAIIVGSKNGSTDWHSVFIAHPSTGLESMGDVVESTSDIDLVFGDPISTSGTVMPTYFLRKKYNLNPKRDFKSLTHVGAHDATATAIAGGSGDLGALNARIYDALVKNGSLSKTVEIWRTPGFADYPWAVAPSIDETTTDAIQKAFTSIGEKQMSKILDQHNVDQYVKTSHEDFEELEEAVQMMGLLEEKSA